jgi:hypothetical protein
MAITIKQCRLLIRPKSGKVTPPRAPADGEHIKYATLFIGNP